MGSIPRGPHPNRVSAEVEAEILTYALDHPTHGAQRVANELRLRGLQVSPSGVHAMAFVWSERSRWRAGSCRVAKDRGDVAVILLENESVRVRTHDATTLLAQLTARSVDPVVAAASSAFEFPEDRTPPDGRPATGANDEGLVVPA